MPKIVFVAGNSRSGTTLMGRILGRDENVFTFHELHFFEGIEEVTTLSQVSNTETLKSSTNALFKNQWDGYFIKQPSEKTRKIIKVFTEKYQPTTARDLFNEFVEFVLEKEGREVAIDQTPRNVLFIEELLTAYPGCKFILMVRDPRDVLLSQKKKWKRRFLGAKNIPLKESFRAWSNYHPITISKLWMLNARKIKNSMDSDSVLVQRYEDLISDPVKALKNIAEFLELEFSDRWLEVPQVGSSAASDTPTNLGIKATNTSLWSQSGGLSTAEIAICESICNEGMENFDYSFSGKSNMFSRIFYQLTWPFKIFLALLLNLGKMKNPSKTIKRRLG